jgi:proteic killer suppression protein
MAYRVLISKLALKQLRKVPKQVVGKLNAWVLSVEQDGLEETRKIPGFHDEPLRGERQGQRSIRLNRSYRAIYRVWSGEGGEKHVEFVGVQEVMNHEY